MTDLKGVPAKDVSPRTKKTNYPAPFAARMEGRMKRVLGDLFGLKNFGVNLTALAPGAASALHHSHSVQDEFLYIVEGTATVFVGEKKQTLGPGMVIGFPAGGPAHHVANETDADITILEIGDRTPGDCAAYPDDDLIAVMENGAWRFTRKDGTPY